ncbi:hypothetical protein BDN72DRAFT_906422 [Pluteus cervinus]|uniref:Uncharacterized protein n=1 Tax=Pluteus cervinus TaxID=181527 RepID=A0ACD3A027_9AGAR|nr:hypothetical protein BDN72DRAFT_906422 [Pluteus cervinus]
MRTAAEKINLGSQHLLSLPTGKSSLVLPRPLIELQVLRAPPSSTNTTYKLAPTIATFTTLMPTRQYFNIYRAVFNGNPTNYSCAMCYLPTDASTKGNQKQRELLVTDYRGYNESHTFLTVVSSVTNALMAVPPAIQHRLTGSVQVVAPTTSYPTPIPVLP